MLQLLKRSKKKPSVDLPDQPMGIYLELPSFSRLFCLMFVVLPMCMLIWFGWSYLLNLWAIQLEPKYEPDFGSGIVARMVNVSDPSFGDNEWNLKELADPDIARTCTSHNFICPTNPWNNETKQIPWTRRCDGQSDCWNRADERNCTFCLTSFSCLHDDGIHLKCLTPEKICDGYADCLDESDEKLYCNRECIDDEIPCTRHDRKKTCVPKSFACAGEQFCMDYEINNIDCEECTGYARSCLQSYGDKESCISVHQMCDGKTDCGDRRDEEFLHCNGTDCPGSCLVGNESFAYRSFLTHRIESWMYKLVGKRSNVHCSDGKWYSPLYACDGQHPQCTQHCWRCMPGAFLCPMEYKCISADKICDKVKHCDDGSDEKDCDQLPDCNDERNRCNGFCNCADCKDESNCTECSKRPLYSWEKLDLEDEHTKKLNNTAKQWLTYMAQAFHCPKDNKCISLQQRCDGKTDCSDGYDEHGCSCDECLLHPYRMYVCQHGDKCFRFDDVCDENFGSRCPNATQLDEGHCSLLKMQNEQTLLI